MRLLATLIANLVADSATIFAAALVVVTVVLFSAIALQMALEVWQIVSFLI